MNVRVAELVTILAIVTMAALGGALAVFSGYDDAPGGVLLGMLLIIGAIALGMRSAMRRR